jgi:DNA-binding NarL/FixJ family response regulator
VRNGDEGDVRVLVADDQSATRAGVRLALERSGFSVCAEVADAQGAIDAAVRERPQICLIDSRVPGSGIAATAAITAKVPETSVIVLSGAPRHEEFLDALRSGALGYLVKDTNPERLPFVLSGVLKGEAAIPRTLVARLVDEFRATKRVQVRDQPGVGLTGRERDVLDLLLTGERTKEIGARLFISRETVRTHIASILRKFGASTRAELLERFEPQR